jgi:uncharacterized protein
MTSKKQKLQSKPANGVDKSLKRPGGLSYLEIPAKDIRQSAAFYEAVLGWQIHGKDSDAAKFSDRAGYLIGRWVTSRPAWPEPGMLPYFYVDQINQSVKRATSHGGEIVKAPKHEGDILVATVRDPAGNLIGLWQAAEAG